MSHARLSPSARHRWGACPASVKAESAYPPSVSGPAAVDGTHSHTLLEWSVKNSLADPILMLGETMTDHDGSFVVDEKRVERVHFALEYLRTRSGTLKSECKVDPTCLIGRTDLKGTVDVQVIGHTDIELIDYKDGMMPVDAENNPQLDQYGFGVLAGFPTMVRNTFKTITFTIIQPKLRDKGMKGISSSTMLVSDFLEGGQKLLDQGNATDDPDAPFVPGESQCKYCRHKGACNALSGQALASAGISFQNLDIIQQSANKEPSSMDDKQIRDILEAAPLIRQMIEGVEAEAMRRFEAGLPIEGLKVVRGRGSRSWSLDDTEIGSKLTKMGIPKASVWQVKLVSPAQAEKLVWEKRDGTKKSLTERQLKTIATEYIKKSDGKLQVVSNSDERQAAIISTTGMFAPVVADPVITLPSWLSL